MKEVKEIKDVLKLIIGAIKGYQAAKADGKLDWADMSQFMPVFPLIQPAIENISEIPAEFKDLDSEEATELAEFVKQELEIDEESKVARIITHALGVASHGYALVSVWREKPKAEA